MREPELIHIVLRVHRQNLRFRRSTQRFDDLNELVNIVAGNKQRLESKHLSNNAARGPHVNLSCVVSGTENQLRGSVASRTDISNVRFSLD